MAQTILWWIFFAYVCVEKLALVDYLRTAPKSIKYII